MRYPLTHCLSIGCLAHVQQFILSIGEETPLRKNNLDSEQKQLLYAFMLPFPLLNEFWGGIYQEKCVITVQIRF